MDEPNRDDLANHLVDILERSIAPDPLIHARTEILEAIHTFAEQDRKSVDPPKFLEIQIATKARDALIKASAAWRLWKEKDPGHFDTFQSRSRELGFDPSWLLENDDIPEIFRPEPKRGAPIDFRQQNRLWIAEHLWKCYGPDAGYKGDQFLEFVQTYSELVTGEPSTPAQFRRLIAKRYRT